MVKNTFKGNQILKELMEDTFDERQSLKDYLKQKTTLNGY